MQRYSNLTIPFLRGPEIETWFGARDGIDLTTENDWSLLPFMALSDGAHAFVSFSPLFTADANRPQDPQKTSPILHFVKRARSRHCSGYHVHGRWMRIC
jgi:hypothetical protein